MSADKTSAVSADKTSVVSQDIPMVLRRRPQRGRVGNGIGMSWETTDASSAATTDALAADATDVLSADTPDVLSADTTGNWPWRRPTHPPAGIPALWHFQFRRNVAKVTEGSSKISLLELASGSPAQFGGSSLLVIVGHCCRGSGGKPCGSDPSSTRAGGQDDGS